MRTCMLLSYEDEWNMRNDHAGHDRVIDVMSVLDSNITE